MNWTYGFLFVLLQFSLIEAQPTRSNSYKSDDANKVKSPNIVYKEDKNEGYDTKPALKSEEEFDFNDVLKYLPPEIVQKIQQSSKKSSPNSPIAILLAANFPIESQVNLSSEEKTRANPADENTKINTKDKTYDSDDRNKILLKPNKISSEMAGSKEIYNNSDESDQPQIEPEQQQEDRNPAGNHEVLEPDLYNRIGKPLIKLNKVSQDSNSEKYNVDVTESKNNVEIPLELVSSEPDYKAPEENSVKYNDLLIKHEEIDSDLEDLLSETLKDKVERISEDHAREIVDHTNHAHSLDELEQIARGGNPDEFDKSHTIAHLNKIIKEDSIKNLLIEDIPEDSVSKFILDDDTDIDHIHHEDYRYPYRYTKPRKHHHSMENEETKTYNLSFVFSK